MFHEDRLKRSLDSEGVEQVRSRRKAALLDALGNAGSPRSLSVLVGEATVGGAALGVQHSAIRALRKYQCRQVCVCVCVCVFLCKHVC